MRLLEITLPARHPIAAVDRYAELLGVPVTRDSDSATVTVGWSRLTFLRDDSSSSSHHVAITVPDRVFDSAGEWITQQTPLLTDAAGADHFQASTSWNARSFYFAGPEDSVLKLIARRDRDDAAEGAFGPHHLRGISEIGVAVERPVTEAAAALWSAGLRPYGDTRPGFRGRRGRRRTPGPHRVRASMVPDRRPPGGRGADRDRRHRRDAWELPALGARFAASPRVSRDRSAAARTAQPVRSSWAPLLMLDRERRTLT